MGKEKFLFDEAATANLLRNEILKTSQNLVQAAPKEEIDFSQFELISKQEEKEEEYVSPIFSMSEDEILCFVEQFEVNELATLSDEELKHIGSVLGVDPKILVEGMD